MVLACVAVLLPCLLFSVVQYRSLAGLEGKTGVAVQDNLRQTLLAVPLRTKEKLDALAIRALGGIEGGHAEGEKLDEVALQLGRTVAADIES